MTAKPVEWILAIYYGPSAHRATYGRLDGTKYTKDYIQLSKKVKFLDAIRSLFPVTAGEDGSVPLRYIWPTGSTTGALVFNSSDRPHLKWETSLGAPKAWKMSLSPSEFLAETIPGDPSHRNFEDAENELAMLAIRGAGQPYLIAIKLHDEATTLHLRAYLDKPSEEYSWADLDVAPPLIQELAATTSQSSALAWKTIASAGIVPSIEVMELLSKLDATETPSAVLNDLDDGIGRELLTYLRRPGYGLFFNPTRNHDAWIRPTPLSEKLANAKSEFIRILDEKYPPTGQGDAAAEAADSDVGEIEGFREKIDAKDYSVADATATTKTRGSAQRAFANAVKANYSFKCAVTGIGAKDFLIASHIVPWSEDQSIRLDPSNGICLSLLMDRAFEKGYLIIEDDLTIRINEVKIGDDLVLLNQLLPYAGLQLTQPNKACPRPEYLQRRRALIALTG